MNSDLGRNLADEILLVLHQGPESTLLILEALEERGLATERAESYSEAEVLSALRSLEVKKKVTSEGQEFVPTSENHGGLPELKLGRDNVVWWSLTPDGHANAG